jgi:hypothetical protein
LKVFSMFSDIRDSFYAWFIFLRDYRAFTGI